MDASFNDKLIKMNINLANELVYHYFVSQQFFKLKEILAKIGKKYIILVKLT